jgi:hypothetical protein
MLGQSLSSKVTDTGVHHVLKVWGKPRAVDQLMVLKCSSSVLVFCHGASLLG